MSCFRRSGPQEKLVAEFDRPDGIWPGSLEGQWVYLIAIPTRTGVARWGIQTCYSAVCPGYDILYMEGARTCASDGSAECLRGDLCRQLFDGHFPLEWYDEGYPAGRENHATLENPSLLSMSFPLDLAEV